MNPLKERRTAAAITKTIATLFICASLLVGFMGMSLSFTQPAMAQAGPPEDTPQGPPEEDTTTTEEDTTTTEEDTTTTEEDTTTTITTQGGGPPADTPQGPPADTPRGPPEEPPQCSPGERFVPGEGCIKDVCPPETDVERDDKCFEIVEVELQKICPPGTDREVDGKCIDEQELAKVPGACPATHPVPAPDNKCAERLNPAGNPAGERIERPLVCPPGTDREEGGKCIDEVELQKICPPGTDREVDGKCIDEQEKELQKVPVSRKPGRGNA